MMRIVRKRGRRRIRRWAVDGIGGECTDACAPATAAASVPMRIDAASVDLANAAAQAATGLLDLTQFHRADRKAVVGQRRALFVGQRSGGASAHPYTVVAQSDRIAGERLLLGRRQPDRAFVVSLRDRPGRGRIAE